MRLQAEEAVRELDAELVMSGMVLNVWIRRQPPSSAHYHSLHLHPGHTSGKRVQHLEASLKARERESESLQKALDQTKGAEAQTTLQRDR